LQSDPSFLTSMQAQSAKFEIESSLADLRERLQRELAASSPESLVRVAAIHNELRALPSDTGAATRVECLLSIAQFFYVSGHSSLGLDPATKAVDTARALGDHKVLRKSLTFLGALLADTGNVPSAVECYASALDLAQRSGDRVAEGAVWNNLGGALLYSAQYADATRCFERCLKLAEGEQQLSSVVPLALTNMAIASLHCEEFEKGIESAERAVAALSNPSGASEVLHRVLAEAHYSKLLLEVNNLDAARAHCDAAKSFSAVSHSQRAELTAAIAEGMYEVYAGKRDIGLSRLQAALQQARVLKFSLRDALMAMVKAHDRVGNHQLALVHLRELLSVTRRTQQERALSHHKMHLSTLGMQSAEGALLDPLQVAAGSTKLEKERVRLELALLVRQSIAAELIEDPSGEHIFRVGKLSALLGAELGLDDDTCFMLEMSARLHDIGKIGIPEAIIAKRGKINPDQRALVQTHANIGAELLSQSGLPHIQMAVDVARHHHEKWDGSGYPDGLAMEAIPEVARIVALADSFDAMTHDRPYRKAMSVENTLSEMNAAAGTKFDPGMTDTFAALVARLREEHSDLDAFLGAEAQESPFIRARKKISEALQQAKDSGGLAGV
jgi:putative two-component system response regulator